MTRAGFFLICFLFSASVHAQTPYFRVYDGSFGLPSSEVYSGIQDRQGYLWFATDHGLARFDGYQFKTFDIQAGLPENSVFYFRNDSKGRTWFNTYDGKLGYLFEGEVFAYKFNDVLQSLLRNEPLSNFAVFHSYWIDGDDKAHFFLQRIGYFTIDAQGKLETIDDINNKNTLVIQFDHSNTPFFYGPGLLKFDSIEIHYKNKTFRSIVTQLDDKLALPKNFSAIAIDTTFILSFQHTISRYDGNVFKTKFVSPKYVVGLNIDNEGHIWAMTLGGGVYVLDKSLNVLYHFFKSESFTSFLQDHEGGIWLTSVNKGVFYIPNLHHHTISRADFGFDEPIVNMALDHRGELWTVFFSGKISCLTEKETKSCQLPLASREFIVSVLADPCRDRIWVATDRNLFYIENHQVKRFKFVIPRHPDVTMPAIKSLALDTTDCSLWIGLFYGFSNVLKDGTTSCISHLDKDFHERIECIEVDRAGKVWAGATRGLFSVEADSIIAFGDKYPLLGSRIIALKAINDSIWIGTRGNGLLLLTADSLRQFTMGDGLPSNSVKTLEIFENTIIAGTNNGAAVISRKLKDNNILIKRQLGSMELLSKEVQQVIVKNDSVIILSKAGISVFNDFNSTAKTFKMPILIRSLKVKNQAVRHGEEVRIPYENNSLSIEYFGISYLKSGKHTYRHRLLGLEYDWIINQQTQAQYPFLPAGSYRFEVEVLNTDGQWSSLKTPLTIIVEKPYWQKWWFVFLLVIALSSIAFGLFRMIESQRHRNRQRTNDLHRYKQEALANQMNPHFLFNALNTVQRYILDNDKISSTRYLSTFSSLMRTILNHSQLQRVSLEDEINVLRLYVEMESARFKDRFTQTIECEAIIDQKQTLIPVFFIQPLVENAIKHGLMNSTKQGMLSINFICKNNDLICIVEDNGIGRKAASALKPLHDKTSLGISIIQKRISLINQSSGTSIRLEYLDLYDELKTPQGTKAIIIFPETIQKLYQNE